MFCSSLSNEYLLIACHFGLDRHELIDLCSGAIDGIFGGKVEKERLRNIVSAMRLKVDS